MALQGSILGPQEHRKSDQNHTFEHRLALGPSKNALWKGVPKIHEIWMKKWGENDAKMMIKLMRNSIKICWNLKLAKPWFLRHVPSENRFLQDPVIPKIYKKSWKIDAKSMLEKWWKIDAKMAPKIHENGSQNRPGADLGLQFLVLGGFWSDAKISWFSDAFLEAQKIGKSCPKTSQKATWDPRLRTR